MKYFKINMNNKGFSAMIATIILVGISTAISIAAFLYIDAYSKSQVNQIENPDLIKNSQVKFLYALNGNVTIYNPYENLQIRESIISGTTCSSLNVNESKGPFQINVSSCSSLEEEILVLETNKGIFQIEISLE